MIYAQVNDKKLKLLEKELKATKDVKWYRRLKIIQLSSQGEKIPQLAKQFDVCQATVRDYIKRYNSGGLETLKPDKSSGRPRGPKAQRELRPPKCVQNRFRQQHRLLSEHQ